VVCINLGSDFCKGRDDDCKALFQLFCGYIDLMEVLGDLLICFNEINDGIEVKEEFPLQLINLFSLKLFRVLFDGGSRNSLHFLHFGFVYAIINCIWVDIGYS
jgi:hypothetical protein